MLLIDEIAGCDAEEIGSVETRKPTISVRELVRMRVELEWKARKTQVKRPDKQNQNQSNMIELRLNAGTTSAGLGLFATMTEGEELEQLWGVAEQAFSDQRLFVLLDNSQAKDLEEVVDVASTASATFLLLTPLQGG